MKKNLPHNLSSHSVRPDASTDSAVNATLISHSVRPDASIDSAVNATLISHSVRPELVEGFKNFQKYMTWDGLVIYQLSSSQEILHSTVRGPSTRSGRTV